MKYLFSTVFLITASQSVWSQDPSQMPEPSLASRKYHESRQLATEPTFGLAKVKSLIKKLKADNEDNMRMSEKQFSTLSIEERFTYTMIHGEDSTQNCDAMPPILDEHKKVFGYFPGAFNDEMTWSDQQRKFLASNRKKVLGLLRITMASKRHAGVNLKSAITEINATELVPDLCALYKRDRKDHDILTVLMILMSENKYPQFLASASWKKLYGPESNYQGYLEANIANQNLIMERALGLHKLRHRK